MNELIKDKIAKFGMGFMIVNCILTPILGFLINILVGYIFAGLGVIGFGLICGFSKVKDV